MSASLDNEGWYTAADNVETLPSTTVYNMNEHCLTRPLRTLLSKQETCAQCGMSVCPHAHAHARAPRGPFWTGHTILQRQEVDMRKHVQFAPGSDARTLQKCWDHLSTSMRRTWCAQAWLDAPLSRTYPVGHPDKRLRTPCFLEQPAAAPPGSMLRGNPPGGPNCRLLRELCTRVATGMLTPPQHAALNTRAS